MDLPVCKQSFSDPIHLLTDAGHWNQLWWLPDALLLSNVLLAIMVGVFSQPCAFYVTVLLVYLALHVIRRVIRNRHNCQIAGMHVTRPDRTRYAITGHLLTTAFLTYLLWYGKSQVPPGTKIASLVITLLLGVTSILSREHYTADVIWTWMLLLVLLWMTRCVSFHSTNTGN